MKSDFLVALTQLAAERNLPREAVLSAIEAGADMVEFDVRLTKDRKLVCFHDTKI